MSDLINSTDDEFIKNVCGYSVVFINYLYLENGQRKKIDDASYHLHFLYSYNSSADSLDINCLDLNEPECILRYSKMTKDEQEKARKEKLENIIYLFIEQSKNLALKNENKIKNYIFQKVPDIYWDTFNNFKKQKYAEGIMQFYGIKSNNVRKNKTILSLRYNENEIKAGLEIEILNESVA